MKKTLFALLTIGLVATSCSKDNTEETVQEKAQILGTWKYSKFVTYSGKDGSVLSSETVSGCQLQDNIEFKADNTFTEKYYNSNVGGPCTLGGTDNGSYTYNETTKEISTTLGSATHVVKVQKLTSTTLETYNTSSDENGDGFLDKEIVYLYK
ncbi:MAG: lipocalin family protein [Bacteroidetes bacterium]|nr:lipocalin family protein [Bacteroidota bacterium]